MAHTIKSEDFAGYEARTVIATGADTMTGENKRLTMVACPLSNTIYYLIEWRKLEGRVEIFDEAIEIYNSL